MAHCTECGFALPKDALFCPNCGAKVPGDDLSVGGDDVDGYAQKPIGGDDVDGYAQKPVGGDDVDGYAQKPIGGDDVDGYAAAGSVAIAAGGMHTIGGLQTEDPTLKADGPGAGGGYGQIALNPGDVFADRYTIENVIGHGGMGIVYKATDKHAPSKATALKLINPRHVVGETATRRLIDEGLTSRDIRHPNVVAVYDVGVSGGQPFMTMEHLSGQSLRQYISGKMHAGGRIPFSVASQIVREILGGLQAAHEAGIVHRDLKPENIILTEEPTKTRARLKILDFGIARATGGAVPSASSAIAMGTVGYMAPEQKTAPDAVKPSADLYSVSVIFYELLSLVIPDSWQPPSGGRNDVPTQIDDLIKAGMSNNRDARPQTAEEYLARLDRAASGKVWDGNDVAGSLDRWRDKMRDKMGLKPAKKTKWSLQAWIGVGLVIVILGMAVIYDELSGGGGGYGSDYGWQRQIERPTHDGWP